jgi:sRNA-binding regulator protein Hfq
MVYKHAISTIVPSRNVRIASPDDSSGKQDAGNF